MKIVFVQPGDPGVPAGAELYQFALIAGEDLIGCYRLPETAVRAAQAWARAPLKVVRVSDNEFSLRPEGEDGGGRRERGDRPFP